MAAPKGHARYGGRKKGVPNKATADIREVASQYTETAVATLAEIMNDIQAPAAARVAAVKELLDRGHGRSQQAVDVTTAGNAINVPNVIEFTAPNVDESDD